jgi:hypothetical protein
VLRQQRGDGSGNLPATLDRWLDWIGEVFILVADGTQIDQGYARPIAARMMQSLITISAVLATRLWMRSANQGS